MRTKRLKLKLLFWLGFILATNSALASNSIIDQAHHQANVMKARIMKERDDEIAAHQNSIQNKIQVINEDAEIEIAKVPSFYYNAWGYRMPNPDYERTVAYIRVDAEKQINAVNKDLATYTKSITANYQEKLNAIDDSAGSVSSQINPGTSEVQLTPVGSNLYVKNYVNYAVEPNNPYVITGLRAKQNSLACKEKAQKKKQTN